MVKLVFSWNKEYCLDISEDNNRCFSVYFFPDGGGTVKSFEKFVDYFFNAILKSNIINECLVLLRYEAINELGWGELSPEIEFQTTEDFMLKLTNDDWFKSKVAHSKWDVGAQILKQKNLASLPSDFPLYKDISILKNKTIQIQMHTEAE